MARRLGRRFIGLERDPDYAAIARKRIAEVEPLAGEDVAPKPSKRAEPRIPFGVLIEAGLLQPGTVLSDLSGRLHARVRADGTLSADNALGQHRGSIHQVGAAVQGAPACNGWTFWHFEQAGARLPIDHLRQQVQGRALKPAPPHPEEPREAERIHMRVGVSKVGRSLVVAHPSRRDGVYPDVLEGAAPQGEALPF